MRRRLIFSAVLVLAFALGCGGILDDPKDIALKVDAPLRVRMGEGFQVVVTVTNSSSEAQTLNSLDIADAYIDGIAITSSVPPYSEASHVPIDNSWSHRYMLEIPPGGQVQVTLNASALKAGDWAGDIDACINNDVSFLSMPVRTFVE